MVIFPHLIKLMCEFQFTTPTRGGGSNFFLKDLCLIHPNLNSLDQLKDFEPDLEIFNGF